MSSLIEALLQSALNTYRLPGLGVVIRRQQQEVFAGGVGYYDAAGQRAVSELTPFGVASLSKFVTTMMVLLLQQRGALSVNDRLVEYFPTLRLAHMVPISLAHLLSHSAGLPGLPGRFYARNLDDPDDRSGGVAQRDGKLSGKPLVAMPTIVEATELVSLMNQLEPDLLAPPGKILNYCNEGFCLLGGVVEQIMQRPYAELAQEMIFAPLQMQHSGIGDASFAVSPDAVALPLLRDGNGYRAAGFWRAPLFYPAGGCVSSARDIVRLIGALADNAPLLNRDSKRQIMSRHMSVSSRPGTGIGYGMGLEYQQIDAETTMLWHSGQRAGVSSFMGYLVEEQIALSVLCNVADAPVTTIAHDLLGQVLGRSDICWPPSGLSGSRDLVAVAPARFIGRYASDEGNDYVVKQLGGEWWLSSGSASPDLPLRFAGSDFGTAGSHTFRFLSEPDGTQVWALALDLRVLRRVA